MPTLLFNNRGTSHRLPTSARSSTTESVRRNSSVQFLKSTVSSLVKRNHSIVIYKVLERMESAESDEVTQSSQQAREQNVAVTDTARHKTNESRREFEDVVFVAVKRGGLLSRSLGKHTKNHNHELHYVQRTIRSGQTWKSRICQVSGQQRSTT